jgi:hypothetical protein
MKLSIWILLTLVAAQADAEVPTWLREAATAAHPAYPPQTKAVVLFREEKVVLEDTGRQVTTTRLAIKVLTQEGKREAMGVLSFDNKDAKVRDLKGWVVQPTGKSRELSRKEASEASMVDYELYSSMRVLALSGGAEIDPGGVFGFEATLDEKTIFSQFSFSFQTSQPHLLSRFQLTLPTGWTAKASGIEGSNVNATVDGTTYTWEARAMPFVEREPAGPRLSSLVPRIRVSAIAPAGASTAMATFDTWKDVSVWETQLTASQSAVTPLLESKARELTAGKSNPLDQIRALAEFVQGIRYVAIQTNISKGGGFVPHAAEQVLKTAYGDCKDKSNLLMTLLKVIGVRSYLTGIYSGDPRYTVAEWASPMQFNHEILAIAVPNEASFPALTSHPTLGKLLFFDPTDSVVPFGFLPDHEQNSLALVLAHDSGALIRTPATAPSANHLKRDWNLTLAEDGKLSGTLTEVSTGQEAFDSLRRDRQSPPDEVRKFHEARFARAVPGSALTKVDSKFDPASNTYTTSIAFNAASYAKVLQDRLWFVRTAPMPYYGFPNLSKSTRTQPVILDPASFEETIVWTLPATLKIDEFPDSGQLTVPFGKAGANWKIEGNTVTATRNMQLQASVIPPAEYKQARDFFLQFNGLEAAPIVLLKK